MTYPYVNHNQIRRFSPYALVRAGGGKVAIVGWGGSEDKESVARRIAKRKTRERDYHMKLEAGV